MSKRDVRFSLLLLLAVAATLSLKISTSAYDLALDSAAMTRALQASLARQGFQTRYEPHHYSSDVVEAVRGSCQLRIRDGTQAGGSAVIFARGAKGLGPIRYVDHGVWRDKPPLLRISIAKTSAHFLARIGWSLRFEPVLAVAARGCDPAGIDLGGLTLGWVPKP